RIELRGFGVFQVKPRKRGIGRNPRTGKEVRIPPGRTIRFKPGKDLQNIGYPSRMGPSSDPDRDFDLSVFRPVPEQPPIVIPPIPSTRFRREPWGRYIVLFSL